MEKLYISLIALLMTINLAYGESGQAWQLFHSSEDGIDLYRARENKEGIIPFKAVAMVKGSVDDYLKHLLDSKGRKQWAPKLKDIIIHKKLGPNHFIYSELYHTPWPATDRQFLLEGKVIFGKDGKVTLEGRNAQAPEFIQEDHIVCDVSTLRFEIMPIDSKRVELSFEFLGDMKGWMPTWLINLIQRKWPMRFIQGIRKEVEKGSPEDYSIFNNLDRN